MRYDNIETAKMWTLNTGHVSRDEAAMLDDANCTIKAMDSDYGWLIYTHQGLGEEELVEYPNVIAIMRAAVDAGIEWLRFDRDAELYPEHFPTFDW